MSNALNVTLQPPTGPSAKSSSAIRPTSPNPDQLAEGYAVKPPEVRKLDPLVPPPSLEDFEMQWPPLFPGIAGLPNPEVKPPAGVDKLLEMSASKRAAQMGGDTPGVAVSINRAAAVMESAAAAEAAQAPVVLSLDDPAEANVTASITRDQIRYEPKVAVAAQANSTAANVLALLK